MAQAAGCHTVLEPSLQEIGGDARRRADVKISGLLENGKDVYVDVCIVSETLYGKADKTAKTRLAAANSAFERKTREYTNQNKDPANKTVWFFVMEAGGAMHPKAAELMAMIAHRAANRPPDDAGWSAPSFLQYWIQRISLTLCNQVAFNCIRSAQAAARLAADPNNTSMATHVSRTMDTAIQAANSSADAPSAEGVVEDQSSAMESG
jgi:hypothetical protein